MTQVETTPVAGAHLKPRFLSHGTVECRDLGRAARFYTEMLGMEVRQTSDRSLMMRLNSTTTIACVETKGETAAGIYSHFGLDFETLEEVDEAYRIALVQKDEYGIQKITKPVDQHGTYSFYIIDMDGNWWEILTNPDRGYSYIFDIEEETRKWRDQNQARDRRERWEKAKTDA